MSNNGSNLDTPRSQQHHEAYLEGGAQRLRVLGLIDIRLIFSLGQLIDNRPGRWVRELLQDMITFEEG